MYALLKCISITGIFDMCFNIYIYVYNIYMYIKTTLYFQTLYLYNIYQYMYIYINAHIYIISMYSIPSVHK